MYNLKEAMLAKCYIEVLGLDKHSEAAQRLIKWKQPIDGQVGAALRFLLQMISALTVIICGGSEAETHLTGRRRVWRFRPCVLSRDRRPLDRRGRTTHH